MGAVEKYRAGAEAKSIAYHEANYPGLAAKMGGHERLTIKEGDRYVRLSKGVPGDKYGGSAHSFVDKTNGDILKPASYKTPAKGARGNVFDKDSTNAASAYGAKYMRDLKPAAAPKAAPKTPLSADAKAQRAGSKADKIHGEASKAIGAEHVQNLLGSGFAFRRGSTVPQIARGGAAGKHGLDRTALDALSRAGIGVTFNPGHRTGGPRVGGP